MDSVEVQEFLLSATAGNDSILRECDKIFEKTNDDSTQSMYFSINDDTMSNKLVDDLQQCMDRTLTDDVTQEHTADSVIERTTTTMVKNQEEESFQHCLPLKMFPNHPLRSQCSTPKLELAAPQKAPELDLKFDPSMAIPDLVLPLTTVLQKLEKKKKVVIMEDDQHCNKENVKVVTKDQELPKDAAIKKPESKDAKGVLPKKVTLRKSLIPNVGRGPQPPLMGARKSVRLSVVPTTFKSTARFTLGAGVATKTVTLNPTTTLQKSPKIKKLGAIAKTSRMTITAPVVERKPAAMAEKQEEVEKPQPKTSRIPPCPVKAANHPPATHRPLFACDQCKKTFHLKSTLVTHQKMHTNAAAAAAGGGTSGTTTVGGSFKCSFCAKGFEKEVGLRNHVERYCEKVPVAEKRKLNGTHNRTRTTSAEVSATRDRSKRDKSGGSKLLESTSSSTGSSSVSQTEPKDPQPAAPQATQPPPASGLSPRKPIKSILMPHSGIKFSANKPINCYHCKISFHKYVDFHAHVDQMHPQPVGSPGANAQVEEEKEKETSN